MIVLLRWGFYIYKEIGVEVKEIEGYPNYYVTSEGQVINKKGKK